MLMRKHLKNGFCTSIYLTSSKIWGIFTKINVSVWLGLTVVLGTAVIQCWDQCQDAIIEIRTNKVKSDSIYRNVQELAGEIKNLQNPTEKQFTKKGRAARIQQL